MIKDLMFLYEGEIDEDGRMCGEGCAKYMMNQHFVYQGTFYDDKIEGLCKLGLILMELFR